MGKKVKKKSRAKHLRKKRKQKQEIKNEYGVKQRNIM